jgi:hypothetical protein
MMPGGFPFLSCHENIHFRLVEGVQKAICTMMEEIQMRKVPLRNYNSIQIGLLPALYHASIFGVLCMYDLAWGKRN